MSRFERARGLPELQSRKLHGRHSVSARGAHAGGELVQSPGEIYVDQKAVPATMNKSSLQIEAETLSRDIQTPSTMLVWIDVVWSGDSVSYKQLFAGTGRMKNHAIDTPRASRWETSDSRWGQDRDNDENSWTCRVSVSEAARYVNDTINQVIPVTAEVPDAADSLNIEFERVKLTQEAEIARDEGRLAEEAEVRELSERPLLGQMTLECAKENRAILARRFQRTSRGLTK